MTRYQTLFAAAVLAALWGCATVAPAELVNARNSYARAAEGPAARLTPTDLYQAQKSLEQANQEFKVNGDTYKTRDYAYIATRKVELAESKARTQQDQQRIAEAVKAGVAVRDTQVKSTQAALVMTREQLDHERRQNQTANQELQKTTQQLEQEKQARLAAEGRLAGAMKDLAEVAAVKEEARGVVITLSGSVLFASGKDTLLQTAQARLDQVATALVAQGEEKRIVVEGHTDSQGSAEMNQALSLRRATTVCNYLISRGVDANKISPMGMGASRPIVDNKTAENRANNRRVEIIIGGNVDISTRTR